MTDENEFFQEPKAIDDAISACSKYLISQESIDSELLRKHFPGIENMDEFIEKNVVPIINKNAPYLESEFIKYCRSLEKFGIYIWDTTIEDSVLSERVVVKFYFERTNLSQLVSPLLNDGSVSWNFIHSESKNLDYEFKNQKKKNPILIGLNIQTEGSSSITLYQDGDGVEFHFEYSKQKKIVEKIIKKYIS